MSTDNTAECKYSHPCDIWVKNIEIYQQTLQF